MNELVGALLGAQAVLVVGILRVVWRLSERVARLEGKLNGPTRRERRG